MFVNRKCYYEFINIIIKIKLEIILNNSFNNDQYVI